MDIHYPFSGRPAFDKIMSYIKKAKDAGGEVLIGGTGPYLFHYALYYICSHFPQATIPRGISFSLLSS